MGEVEINLTTGTLVSQDANSGKDKVGKGKAKEDFTEGSLTSQEVKPGKFKLNLADKPRLLGNRGEQEEMVATPTTIADKGNEGDPEKARRKEDGVGEASPKPKEASREEEGRIFRGRQHCSAHHKIQEGSIGS